MDIDKVFEYYNDIQNDLTFEEICKLFREVIYTKYEKFDNEQWDKIHCYQLLKSVINIFEQMVDNDRKFEEDYLKNTIKW